MSIYKQQAHYDATRVELLGHIFDLIKDKDLVANKDLGLTGLAMLLVDIGESLDFSEDYIKESIAKMNTV